MELVFVRHTSVAVPKGTCYGVTDVPLNETFETEASEVKAKLSDMLFDKVYSSPLSRCRKLAEYCCQQPINIDQRLTELNFGNWEMQKFEEITDPRINEWYADYMNVKATGGESFMDQHIRIKSFLDDISKQKCERIAIFTHGGILMQIMLIFRLATLDNIIDLQPQYGAILKVSI